MIQSFLDIAQMMQGRRILINRRILCLLEFI